MSRCSPVTNSVLSRRAGDQLGAGWQSTGDRTCRRCQRVARGRPNRGRLVTLWALRSWQSKAPGDSDCHLLASEAGDRIRTDDVQLGKRFEIDGNRFPKKALCVNTSLSDQLGAVRLARGGHRGHRLIKPDDAAHADGPCQRESRRVGLHPVAPLRSVRTPRSRLISASLQNAYPLPTSPRFPAGDHPLSPSVLSAGSMRISSGSDVSRCVSLCGKAMVMPAWRNIRSMAMLRACRIGRK